MARIDQDFFIKKVLLKGVLVHPRKVDPLNLKSGQLELQIECPYPGPIQYSRALLYRGLVSVCENLMFFRVGYHWQGL